MTTYRQAVAVLALLTSTTLVSGATAQKPGVDLHMPKQTLQIHADAVVCDPQAQEITASGHVVITMQDAPTLRAEKVHAVLHDPQAQEITASGQAAITMQDGSILRADKIVVKAGEKGVSIVAQKNMVLEKKPQENK
jgi:lipopolysaccharide export system protein LptA